MALERWGSLSVDDHTDTAALVANVLLYDRLVLPVMTAQVERDERAYWEEHGWHPDLQALRLKQLGELAIQRPWDQQRRQHFTTRFAQLTAEQYDADRAHLTRAILAQEPVKERPPGVHHVQVIAAYNSTAAVRQDFQLADAADQLAAQAWLLTRRLVVPDLEEEAALELAIALSRDPAFQARRRELFDWQEHAVAQGIPPEAAVQEIAERAQAYNALVAQAAGKVRQKLAFTIVNLGLGAVGPVAALLTAGDMNAIIGGVAAAGTAALSLIHFALHDKQPVPEAGLARPAAMFHDIEAHVGVKLTVNN